tara:strand:+ start:378 stop:602 length:225 start_codon:yes stop_codon:yes gene_type:complete
MRRIKYITQEKANENIEYMYNIAYDPQAHSPNERVYLMDGMWVYPDGSIEDDETGHERTDIAPNSPFFEAPSAK